jgi:hypothetical protein
MLSTYIYPKSIHYSSNLEKSTTIILFRKGHHRSEKYSNNSEEQRNQYPSNNEMDAKYWNANSTTANWLLIHVLLRQNQGTNNKKTFWSTTTIAHLLQGLQEYLRRENLRVVSTGNRMLQRGHDAQASRNSTGEASEPSRLEQQRRERGESAKLGGRMWKKRKQGTYEKDIQLFERENISLPKIPLSVDPLLRIKREPRSQSSQCCSGTRCTNGRPR